MRTLRDVADKLSAGCRPRPSRAARSLRHRPRRGCPAVAHRPPTVDVTALALEVVSEKTGYPVEMLDLDMEMEAGPWDRLDQAGRDPVRVAGTTPRYPGDCAVRACEHAHVAGRSGQAFGWVTGRGRSRCCTGRCGIGRERGCACGCLNRHADGRRNRACPRGRLGEDRLPGRDARSGYGDGGRALGSTRSSRSRSCPSCKNDSPVSRRLRRPSLRTCARCGT